MSADTFLLWLDQHPQSYCWPVGALIVVAVGIAAAPFVRGHTTDGRNRHDWLWGLMLFAILAAGRWPSMMIPREFNADETHVFASAHALAHDTVFWRSVDGHTAGPLNFFGAIPAGWLFGWDSYFGIRLTALVLLATCLTFVHQCLSLVFSSRAARLATLATAVFEALTNSTDFLHNSTELPSLVWLSVAAYAAVRRWLRQGGPAWSGLGGLMLGAVPLSKLQPAPLALAAGLYWAWAELRARGPEAPRHRLYLMAGAMLPALLFILPVVIAGQWDNFLIPYLRFNLGYAAAGGPLPSLLRDTLASSLATDSLLHFWLPGTLLWCALAFRIRTLADQTARRFTLLALAATVISIYCVLQAGRPFLHYWQLPIPAATLLLGGLIGGLATTAGGMKKSDRWLMVVCALALTAAMVGQRVRRPNEYLGVFTLLKAQPRTNLADHIRAHAQPGETLAVWGWSNYLYVETGLRQATREAHVERIVMPGPFREYLRERYLADLMVAQPAMFVDSVGPSSLNFLSPAWKHERNYPLLAAVIRRDYVLVDEADGAQIYRRRDLAAPRGPAAKP